LSVKTLVNAVSFKLVTHYVFKVDTCACPPGVVWECSQSQLPGAGLVTNAHPRRLHSADARMLLVSQTRTNFSDRVFSAAGPRVWNCLPTNLRQLDL